jgi:alpha- and gamma-adaptin-binding protein p34
VLSRFTHIPLSQYLHIITEKVGIPRVLEALEANDWSQGSLDADSDFGDFEDSHTDKMKNKLPSSVDEDAIQRDDTEGDGDLDPESLDFGFDRADFKGLKKAIWTAGGEDGHEQDEEDDLGDDDVQKLERMMLKLQAVRDMSGGLPDEQRKKMAKQAVGEAMKDL